MRAARQTNRSGLEGVSLEEVDPPEIRDREVLIDIHMSGLNFADLLMTRGDYQATPDTPFTLGLEVAGIVRSVHPNTDGVFTGDRVMARVDCGAFAEQVAARDADCAIMPHSMSFEEGAAFPIAYGTAYIALIQRAKLTDRDTVLIHGASGGAGLAAVQICKAVGARSIATVRKPENRSIAANAGADHVIDLSTNALRTAVTDILSESASNEVTAQKGVDIVFDPVGGDLFRQSLRCVNPFARMLIIGFASGEIQEIPANIALVKNIDLIGVYWGAYSALDPEALKSANHALQNWYEDGFLKPTADAVYSLDQAKDALQALQDRKHSGKIVLKVR